MGEYTYVTTHLKAHCKGLDQPCEVIFWSRHYVSPEALYLHYFEQ